MNQSSDKSNKFSVEETEKYVQDLLNEKLPKYMTFHDWNHTLMVKEEAVKLAEASNCTDEEIEILILGALFHDIGYTRSYDDHEKVGIQLAEKFLESVNYPAEKISRVTRLIHATNHDVEPETKLEKLLVDADMAHLGKKKYKQKALNLKNERMEAKDIQVMDMEWARQNIEFIENHEYYTKAATDRYLKRKLKNLAKLKKRYKTLSEESSISSNKAARMIFKTALRNHIDLTNIADQKANIMLTINAVILTLGTPLFPTFLMDKPMLKYPAIIFLVTCAVTMILATLATRPVKSDGKTNLSKLFSGKTNLFFFGNFYNLKLNEYHKAVYKVMSDPATLDKNIINDLYYLGNALGVKYKMLRSCYTVFATGLVITLIALAISYGLVD